MSTDNRITLNDCSAVTGWAGDDSVTVITTTGDFYQGSSALSTQLSNSDEHMYTTSIGGTRNFTSVQVWNLIKDNLIETLANGGSQMVLHDGTNRIGYDVGGNDSPGLQLPTFYNSYRLDTSNLPAAFATYAGSEASLNQAAITGVGYGTIHLAKAVGSIDNVRMDRFSFIANGSPALTINGGTSGTPETLTDVAGDDVTNGWGLVANLIASRFDIFCSTEWGDGGTADSYFEQENAQLFFIGTGLGVGNFDMSLVGNATGTNSFVLNNCVCVNVDTRANWDFNVANFNTVSLTGVSWTGFGTFELLATGGTYTGQTWDDCGRITLNGASISDCTISNSAATTSALLVVSVAEMTGVTNASFVDNTNGHSIEITATGTYTFSSISFSGGGSAGTTTADVYNNSGGAVTINVSGGSTPTIRNGTGASTTVNNTVNVTLTGLIAATRIKVYRQSDNVELGGVESSGTSFTVGLDAAVDVTFRLISLARVPLEFDLTVPSTDTTIPVSQQSDRVYENN